MTVSYFIIEVNHLQKMKEEIISGEKTLIELIESLRFGSDDYDLESTKKIDDGGQATILEIQSKKDGKTYIAKRL